ncbi:hypothetical protein [Coleofasciculus chthonoplastes]|uniref:hypothetical protein n=1 Tax=Coleofasciculus chthonoplastes TaxID=64178 RepID=UPI0032FED02E
MSSIIRRPYRGETDLDAIALFASLVGCSTCVGAGFTIISPTPLPEKKFCPVC